MKLAGKLFDGLRKLAKRQAERFWDSVVLNPVAWLLFGLLIFFVHWNNISQGQLDTVCDAIEIPENYVFRDKPKTALEKAQDVCAAREQDIDMPED